MKREGPATKDIGHLKMKRTQFKNLIITAAHLELECCRCSQKTETLLPYQVAVFNGMHIDIADKLLAGVLKHD